MANWQLTLVILASVLVGALIPLLITLTVASYRAGKEIAAIGAQLKGTLTQFETIAGRAEMMSRGFERNMTLTNMFSTIIASVAAFVETRFPAKGTGKPSASDVIEAPDNGPAP